MTPQPFIMGGFAEDAVLYHRSTRPHEDIDWFITRDQLEAYDKVAKQLGFPKMGIYGKTSSGKPFYIAWTKDESFWIECLIADRDEKGNLYCELAELNFDTTGLPPFKPFRLFLPHDILSYSPVQFENFELKTISPLGLYQIRTGLNKYKTFGEYRDKDKKAAKGLKEVFFQHLNDKDLIPKTELL
jgi:hypothetical protein